MIRGRAEAGLRGSRNRDGLAARLLVLALGYGAGRRKFIDSRNLSTLNQLVVSAIPASLFVSISSGQRSAITSHGTYIVIVIAMLLVYAVVLWLQLKVFRLGKGSAAGQALTVSFLGLASIGLPLSAPSSVTRAPSRWRPVSRSGP